MPESELKALIDDVRLNRARRVFQADMNTHLDHCKGPSDSQCTRVGQPSDSTGSRVGTSTEAVPTTSSTATGSLPPQPTTGKKRRGKKRNRLGASERKRRRLTIEATKREPGTESSETVD